MSDAGAAVNKKADEAKKDGVDGTDVAATDGTAADGAATDGTGDATGDGTGDGTADAPDGAMAAHNGGGTDSHDTGRKAATTALVQKALADQGIVTSAPPNSTS
jgi:hypothetical protein